MAHDVDASSIAQRHEQGLPPQPFRCRSGIRINEHAIGRQAALPGNCPNQSIPHGSRIELFDKPLHFAGADVDERVAHECVCSFALFGLKLLERPRRDFCWN